MTASLPSALFIPDSGKGPGGKQGNRIKKGLKKKGDYVLSLKENHPETHREAAELFGESGLGEPEYSEVTKDHGRIEKREAWLSTDISWFAGKEQWEGLNGSGCICSSRTVQGKTTTGQRYFLTSLTGTTQFARSVRTHWGIENKLHRARQIRGIWTRRFGKITSGTGRTIRRRTWRC
jgi:predicted transposase YbfD/YdcC